MPLLRERRRFAGSADFRLYDVVGRRRRARRGRLRLLERARRRPLADRLPQPVRRRRPAGSATRSRSPSRPPTARRRSGATRSPTALGLAGRGRRLARASATRDPGWSRSDPVGEIRERGLFVELDAYGCLVLASCARSPRPPTSRGRRSRPSSAGAGCRRSTRRSRTSGCGRSTTRRGGARPATDPATVALRRSPDVDRRASSRPTAFDDAAAGRRRSGGPGSRRLGRDPRGRGSRSAWRTRRTTPDARRRWPPPGWPTGRRGRSSRSTTGTVRTYAERRPLDRARRLPAALDRRSGARRASPAIAPAACPARPAGYRRRGPCPRRWPTAVSELAPAPTPSADAPKPRADSRRPTASPRAEGSPESAQDEPSQQRHRRRAVRRSRPRGAPGRRSPGVVAVAADDPRLRHRVGAARIARRRGRRPAPASRSRSQIASEPTKYVESWVDESRARSYFARASASSWNAPSTISETASSSVMSGGVDPDVDQRVRDRTAGSTSNGVSRSAGSSAA